MNDTLAVNKKTAAMLLKTWPEEFTNEDSALLHTQTGSLLVITPGIPSQTSSEVFSALYPARDAKLVEASIASDGAGTLEVIMPGAIKPTSGVPVKLEDGTVVGTASIHSDPPAEWELELLKPAEVGFVDEAYAFPADFDAASRAAEVEAKSAAFEHMAHAARHISLLRGTQEFTGARPRKVAAARRRNAAARVSRRKNRGRRA